MWFLIVDGDAVVALSGGLPRMELSLVLSCCWRQLITDGGVLLLQGVEELGTNLVAQ